MTNPYAVSTAAPAGKGVFSHGGRRVRAGFLYRVIEFERPFAGTLIYDGWWFRQKLMIDGHIAWWRISWRTIHRHAEFRLPEAIDPGQSDCRIEIDFSRALWIRRFRIWIDDVVVYDEIN